jgi:hypothetical protein
MLRKLLCYLGQHKRYGVLCSLSDQADLIMCPDCKKRFAINYSVRVVLPWDGELEKFYESFPMTQTEQGKQG